MKKILEWPDLKRIDHLEIKWKKQGDKIDCHCYSSHVSDLKKMLMEWKEKIEKEKVLWEGDRDEERGLIAHAPVTGIIYFIEVLLHHYEELWNKK